MRVMDRSSYKEGDVGKEAEKLMLSNQLKLSIFNTIKLNQINWLSHSFQYFYF